LGTCYGKINQTFEHRGKEDTGGKEVAAEFVIRAAEVLASAAIIDPVFLPSPPILLSLCFKFSQKAAFNSFLFAEGKSLMPFHQRPIDLAGARARVSVLLNG